jgi:Kef-type K+ transport system membrane component KefB
MRVREPSVMDAGVAQVRPNKRPFWRAFGAALVLYTASVAVTVVVIADGYDLVNRVIVIGVSFGLLALKAPRAAAIAALALSVVALVFDVWFGFREAWRFFLLPFDIAALLYSVTSVKLANTYLADRKRTRTKSRRKQLRERRKEMARDYDRNQPW